MNTGTVGVVLLTYIGIVHISPLVYQQLRHFSVTVENGVVERGTATVLKEGNEMTHEKRTRYLTKMKMSTADQGAALVGEGWGRGRQGVQGF